jgi:hypothetical protein
VKRESRITVSTFGTIIGIAGLEHGVGEILQGDIPPPGIVIESWPNNAAYEIMAGEPAMTLLPSMLLSGILTVIMSIILIFWTVKYIDRKYGGLIFILLSFLLLPIGGGFAPPLMGFIVGIFAVRMNRRTDWSIKNQYLGRIWPVIFVSSVIAYFSLWPGMVILSSFLPKELLPMMPLTIFSFATLFLALISSFHHVSGDHAVRS